MSKLPNLLIIADAPEFARTVMARWQTERHVPTFTLLSGELWDSTRAAAGDVAILGSMPQERLEAVLRSLATSETTVVCVVEEAGMPARVRSIHPRALVIPQQDAWVELLVQLCGEIFRRLEAEERARHAEHLSAENRRFATLGRYMLEMRHSFNNALTSLLGNAELLLLQTGAFSADVRDQLTTIRTMALRMNEIMQRFSSLETEMLIVEKQARTEKTTKKT